MRDATKVRDDGQEIMANTRELTNQTPDHEEIAKRAYEIYLRRGGEHGRADEDWVLAEAELRARRRQSRS